MGAKASTMNKVYIDTKSTLSVLNETIVNNSMETLQKVTNVNSFTVDIGPGGTLIGNINTQQSIDVTQEVSAKLSSEVLINLQAQIIAQLGAALDQAAKSKAGFFATTSSASKNITTIKSAVEGAVKNTLKVSNYNTIVQNTVNVNTQKILILGYMEGDINNEQNIVARVVANNVITSIINNTNQILADNKVDVQLRQAAEANSAGIDDIIQGWTNGVTISSIALSVVLCIIVSSLLLVALSPSGQKGINKGVNAGIARYSISQPAIAQPKI